MKLTPDDFKKIKALHVTMQLPVQIFDSDFKRIKSYVSDGNYIVSYNFTHEKPAYSYVWFNYGAFREIFIFLQYKEAIITIGPFLTNRLIKREFDTVVQKLSTENKIGEDDYLKYYSSLPVYSLGDIRDFLVLLGFLFHINLEQLYSEKLHKQVCQNTLQIQKKETNITDTEHYAFDYENKILNLVALGDLALLKKGIADIGHSVVPTPTRDSLRTEKNYTIVITEKLATLAIQTGKDVSKSLQLRDFYIKKVEAQKTLVDVLAVRDSAIIHFAKELHELSDNDHSPLVQSILQYINLKIYDSINVSELAKHFYISESSLRRHFKKEVGISITKYFNQRKIQEAKLCLSVGMSVSEIVQRLSFFDSPHFYRMFKKYEKMTPKQFQEMKLNLRN